MGWIRFGLWSLWTWVGAVVVLCSPRSWHYPFLKIWARFMLWITQAQIYVDWRIPQHEVLRKHPAIVISNHQSYMDIVTLQDLFPWPLHMLTKKQLYWIPVLGWAMQRFGNIRVDREQGQNFIDDQVRRLFQEGRWIYFAPEGTRSWDGVLAPKFKSGAFRTAHQFKVPIVVVGIRDSRKVLPKGSFWIRSHQSFKVAVLALLDPSQDPEVLKSRAYEILKSFLA